MASSNRHWPSMFKSKPCNPHQQWQHDLNPSLLSGCHRNPYTSGVEERSPEPKPRWNPKPEQIKILEAIFNSGIVNPPRDEIRKIRAQLQEYGQVGDANVFYWFQNRKSRSKHKNRQQLPKNQSNHSSATTRTTTTSQAATTTTTTTTTTINSTNAVTLAPNSIMNPSSSSDKSSPKLNNPNKYTNYNPTGFTLGSCSSSLFDQLTYSPTTSVNQTTYDHHNLAQLHDQPFMFPASQYLNFTATQQGFPGFSDIQQHQNMIMASNNNNNNLLVNGNDNVGPCTEFLFSELINHPHGGSCDPKIYKDAEDEEKLMMMKLGCATVPASTSSPILVDHLPAVSACSTDLPLPSTLIDHQLQGADDTGVGPMKSTVFINDVAFEVNSGPFHVRDAFGNDAVLLHSTGHPVLTDEWGITLLPLQHGAFYYLI